MQDDLVRIVKETGIRLVGPNGELINANSGRCLDDNGGSTVNGTQLDQQDCYGSVPEIWAAT